MKLQLQPRIAGVLLAGLLSVLGNAHATSGFTITTSRENVVAIGMSTAEVEMLALVTPGFAEGTAAGVPVTPS